MGVLWSFEELAKRALNVTMDFSNLYDVCQEVAKAESHSIFQDFIMYGLAATIFIELVACNVRLSVDIMGLNLLQILDAVQILLTLGIYFDDRSAISALLTGSLKAVIQLVQFYFDLD